MRTTTAASPNSDAQQAAAEAAWHRRNQYVEENLDLVEILAHLLLRRLPPSFEYDDLYQEGCRGLIAAAERYSRALNVPFRVYAAIRIRGAILDSIRRRHWRNATHAPITIEILQMPGAGARELEHRIEHAELARIIGEAKEALNTRDRHAIEEYFIAETQLAGVGQVLGLKQSRSSQVLHEAKIAMRRQLEWRGVRAAA